MNISGNVININVAPFRDSPSSPNDVTAGKIITPIINATVKSSNDTVIAVRVNFVSLGKYEE